MDTLGALESYVCAVQTGSLSGAARLRKMSQPAISQQISALETVYNAQLLHRERAGVRMTHSGELVFKHAMNIIKEKQALQVSLDTLSGNIAGNLTITATISISQHLLGNVIIKLAEQNPELKIVLKADDKVLNLTNEGIDLAIRAGEIGSGEGLVRKIATLTMVHVATPAYLNANGRPKKPEELDKLDYIQFRQDDNEHTMLFSPDGKKIQVAIRTGLTAQLPDLIFRALHSNLGFARTPQFLVSEAIESAQLEEVLPTWRLSDMDLHLVYPTRETLSPRTTIFLKALFKELQKTPGIKLTASAMEMVQGEVTG